MYTENTVSKATANLSEQVKCNERLKAIAYATLSLGKLIKGIGPLVTVVVVVVVVVVVAVEAVVVSSSSNSSIVVYLSFK